MSQLVIRDRIFFEQARLVTSSGVSYLAEVVLGMYRPRMPEYGYEKYAVWYDPMKELNLEGDESFESFDEVIEAFERKKTFQ